MRALPAKLCSRQEVSVCSQAYRRGWKTVVWMPADSGELSVPVHSGCGSTSVCIVLFNVSVCTTWAGAAPLGRSSAGVWQVVPARSKPYAQEDAPVAFSERRLPQALPCRSDQG